MIRETGYRFAESRGERLILVVHESEPDQQQHTEWYMRAVVRETSARDNLGARTWKETGRWKCQFFGARDGRLYPGADGSDGATIVDLLNLLVQARAGVHPNDNITQMQFQDAVRGLQADCDEIDDLKKHAEFILDIVAGYWSQKREQPDVGHLRVREALQLLCPSFNAGTSVPGWTPTIAELRVIKANYATLQQVGHGELNPDLTPVTELPAWHHSRRE